jgi:Zn-finger nucleic acid-binding protein
MPKKNKKNPPPGGEKKLITDIVVHKNCPKCKMPLASDIICNVEVDYCPKCYGLWFEEDELRWAKDEKDKNLKWLDIDLWKDEKKFKISYGIRTCPSCRVPLYEVYYGDSKVIVDICNICHGVWLDRAEFKKIINWLKEKADYEILNNYAKNLFLEAIEVFSGPETIREELVDVITVLKLLNYKLAAQNPSLVDIVQIVRMALPK